MKLSTDVGRREGDEVSAFARYCVHRLERELGAALDAWTIAVAPGPSGAAATVEVCLASRTLTARGDSRDAALAIWNALGRLEQPLRDALHAA